MADNGVANTDTSSASRMHSLKSLAQTPRRVGRPATGASAPLVPRSSTRVPRLALQELVQRRVLDGVGEAVPCAGHEQEIDVRVVRKGTGRLDGQRRERGQLLLCSCSAGSGAGSSTASPKLI